MDEINLLAERFAAQRAHLYAVAYRMLGSRTEADDAVQEAWLRLSRTDTREVENLGGWLTTVVARVCLDALRARKSRPEVSLDADADPARRPAHEGRRDPEQDLARADAVGSALLILLDALAPAERVAFVLHDLFDLSFDEVAPIVGRSSEAARQLASRARRRVQGVASVPPSDVSRDRQAVHAFLAASRDGDFAALLALLDPDALLRADAAAVRTAAGARRQGAPLLEREAHGARAIAEAFTGRARGARAALLDGAPGAVWVQGGTVRAVFAFTMLDGLIDGVELLMDPARIASLRVELEPR